jgi:hypothetical protein
MAKKCEKESRPPCRAASISGFHRRYDESIMLKLHWDRGIADRVCGLRGWSHCGGVRDDAQACSGLRHLAGTTLATTVQFTSGFFWLLSQFVVV